MYFKLWMIYVMTEEFAEYLKMNIFYNYNNIFKPMGIYV